MWMTATGCLGLMYVRTVDLMCSCTVRSASATIMNVWGCCAAETVKSFMNSSWFISIYCSLIAAVSSHSCTTAHCSDFFQKTRRSSEACCLFRAPLICPQQPFHRWQAEKAGRASYSIHFSANMIHLNGEA